MQQFQFDYTNAISFNKELSKIKQWCKNHVVSTIVFQIYSDITNIAEVEFICGLITSKMPDALCMACSTNGNIVDGGYTTANISIVCMVFEYQTTKVKLLQYEYTGDNINYIAENVKEVLQENTWVKAIEFYVTILGQSMTKFCNLMSEISSEIHIFGGGAFNFKADTSKAYVYAKDKGCLENGFVFLFIGGEDFNVESKYIMGWKPLGKKFCATRTDDNILYEFDCEPAYNAYYRYLNIQNDEHFFDNTHEFPFLCERNGVPLLHVPVKSCSDGSLVLTSTINKGDIARITYGDPSTILDAVYKDSKEIQEFSPDVIHIFSCSARKSFWGEDSVSKETEVFQNIAQTTGFFTSGEFLRTGGNLYHHNVTLVIAAMREGEAEYKSKQHLTEFKSTGKVSMLNRLASFIEAATIELEAANHKLAEANDKLAEANSKLAETNHKLEEVNCKLEYTSITDGLTGLYNRREIQKRIESIINNRLYIFSLIMLDIDNFKQVNDTYGHQAGDEVIRTLANIMREVVVKYNAKSSVGRWGGEEFMILLPNMTREDAAEIAEVIRTTFANYKYTSISNQTTSLGVTQVRIDEHIDKLCIRVDKALYKAKTTGKNKVIVYS